MSKKPQRGNVIPFSKTMNLPNGIQLGEVELEVGKHYWYDNRYVRFIQVTPKGFNFLDEEWSRCLFRQHLYAKGFSGKKIPREQKKFTFRTTAIRGLRRISEVV